MDKFWMVTGDFLVGPTNKHPSAELARAEAVRLTKKHLMPFTILESMETCHIGEAPIIWEKDVIPTAVKRPPIQDLFPPPSPKLQG